LSSLLSLVHRQDLTLFLIPLYPDQALQRGDVITDDLARWGSCGIPSIWRSPTTRQPGGSPRPNRCVRRQALPPGCRVVALGEVDGMPHPAHPGSAAAVLVARSSRRSARPARAPFGSCWRWRCVWRCSVAGRTSARVLVVGMAGGLRERWVMLGGVG
jgi:hypothetical protein